MNTLRKASFIICATLILAGCGIKPGSLKPADDSSSNTFPHTYPSSK